MYTFLKHLAPDIVFNVLYIIYYLIYMHTIVLVNVKRFRALCGFYAIENKLILLLLLYMPYLYVKTHHTQFLLHLTVILYQLRACNYGMSYPPAGHVKPNCSTPTLVFFL